MPYHTNQVAVSCAVCGKPFTIKASRATQNKAITCGALCLRALRSANRVRYFGTEEQRHAACDYCGMPFERKPSQLAKYRTSYCSRSCKRMGQRGTPSPHRNGEWSPCETCGKNVWRTPAIKQPHTFCSSACFGQWWTDTMTGTRRVPYTQTACARCGNTIERPASYIAKQVKQHCSIECRQLDFIDATRNANQARKGKPGTPWTEAQRFKVSGSLQRHYRSAQGEKRTWRHSQQMSGPGNPQWRDGRATQRYARGFTRPLKRWIKDRDGYQCRICGIPERKDATLVVHHIDGEKVDHDPENLITLCRPCHGLLHQGKLPPIN